MVGLFDPISFGGNTLSHRVVMAPLTRMRAFNEANPTDLMREYYEQRASKGGLIITEATVISPTAVPHANVPAAYTDTQVDGWRRITEAVHNKGGIIYLQLWHAGRASHRFLQPGGQVPAGPSAIKPDGGARKADGTPVPFETPRALDIDEIPDIVQQYADVTKRAIEAGFDGVEIHSGNGYLPDQFLQDGANKRTDRYGGPIDNRLRFITEVVEACASVIGMEKVGLRISPQNPYNGMSDSTPEATFLALADRMRSLNLGYLHVIEPRVRGNDDFEKGAPVVAAAMLRSKFPGLLMAAGGFTRDTGNELITNGGADLIAYGRHFIANPDLPDRFHLDLPLNKYDRATFYGGDHRGYTDYPFATKSAIKAMADSPS